MHRFLKTGNPTSMPGQEGIPAVYSPMTRTLEDLETFWRAIVSMKPWEYDHSVRPSIEDKSNTSPHFIRRYSHCLGVK